MAFDIASLLSLAGLIIGLWKMGKMGVAEAVVALGLILGATSITAALSAIPIAGGLAPILVGAITGFAYGALVRKGYEMLMAKAKKLV